MAANTAALADPDDGNFDDWFELYNPTTNAVDIAGYFLTDSSSNKFQFHITTNMAHMIPPQGYLLVWADNQTGQNVSGGVIRPDLHVNFQLSKNGEAIGLYAADGTAIDYVTFGLQTNDVSQGRYPDGGASIYFMPGTISPRAANHIPQPMNTAPVLDPIGNRIVYLGQTLSFTATASDSYLPAQLLTFSLDPTPPAGASITSGGAFSWTPSALGTNTLTVRVTDNGTPPLSDSETITVEVVNPPSFTRSLRNGNSFELTWNSQPGHQYIVEYKDDLNATQWLALWTNTAGGGFTNGMTNFNTNGSSPNTISFTNSIDGRPQRFFRIRAAN